MAVRTQNSTGGLIPWDELNADTSHVHAKLEELMCLFDEDPNQQLAFKTIVSEVLRCKLAWHVAQSETAQDAIPVPDWWATFVTDAIRSILINGNFIYRRCGTRAGVPVCIVADPVSVFVTWCDKTNRYIPSCKKHRWKIGLVEPPHRGSASREPCFLLNSAAIRANAATLQLKTIIENWVARDMTNSSNSIYTAVSDDLRNQNGSDRQWFRNVNTTDHMPTRSSDIDTNFNTLVHRRAQTIQQLDAITHEARTRSTPQAQRHVGSLTITTPDKPAAHKEHIVSDGRVYTEARQLGSMADSKMIIDELKHSILFAFGVPPQALGRNINSERIAASNRLTEMAITTYTSFINLLRVRLGDAIKSETLSETASYIGFSVCLAQYELERLQPYLKDTICKKMIARCYEIPESFLDSKKIRAVIEAEHGINTDSPDQTPPSKKRKPSTEKAYTAEDATRNLRNKANKPA
jgi:hypothetical protein